MCPVEVCPVPGPIPKMNNFINRISNPLRIWKDVCLFIQMNIHAHNGNATTAAQKTPRQTSHSMTTPPQHEGFMMKTIASDVRVHLESFKSDNTLNNAWKVFSQLKASLMHAKLNERLESGGLMSRNKTSRLVCNSFNLRSLHPPTL